MNFEGLHAKRFGMRTPQVYSLPGQSGATVMQGLDSLAVRCREYKDAGCRFAKWRSPIVIDLESQQPSDLVIEANMQASICFYACGHCLRVQKGLPRAGVSSSA
jgi:hypothetical protein